MQYLHASVGLLTVTPKSGQDIVYAGAEHHHWL